MASIPAKRQGVKLLELLVVLVLLGLMASLATLAPEAGLPARIDSLEVSIAAARREALRTGEAVTMDLVTAGGIQAVTANPDGSVIAPAALHIERLSGRRAEPRSGR